MHRHVDGGANGLDIMMHGSGNGRGSAMGVRTCRFCDEPNALASGWWGQCTGRLIPWM